MMEVTGGLTYTKKKTLSDTVHDQILEEIIKYPQEEEQVLNEKRLVELFGVSKAPVREALIRLCSEGVLRSVPRFGYVVIQMTEQEAEEVMEMRLLLETEALKATFPKLTELKLSSLKNQIDKTISKQNISIWDVWAGNEEFHLMLASFSGNSILMRFLRECMGMEKRIYAQHLWDANSSMVLSADGVSHMGIYQKLVERDLDGAVELLHRDIRDA